MALTKLTANRLLNLDNVSEVVFHPDSETPFIDLTYRRHGSVAGFRLYREEALEEWANLNSSLAVGK